MSSQLDHTVDSETEAARRLFWTGAALSFAVSLILYVKTMAVSASFWDAGEFIAASYRLGIPHSPGTPLYVLVGRVFSLLPIPGLDVAQRINFLSAFCGAGGILFVYLLVVRFLEFTMGKSESTADTLVKVAGALCGALFLAFSDTYWNNSIESAVYAMSNMIMGFMTWLALKWGENPKDSRSRSLIYLLFFLLALSVGFHLGTILVFSGIFFFILMTRERSFTTTEFLIACAGVGIVIADATLYRNGQMTVFFLIAFTVVLVWISNARSPFALICTGLFLLGLSVHLYLLIRSGHNPNLDEGNPETWRALYSSLRREQYPPTNVFARKADFIFQLQHFNGYFQTQFELSKTYVSQLNLGSMLPIGLGVWGIVDQFSRHRKTFVMLFVTLVVMSLGLIIFLNFSDQEVRERDYFYSPAFYFFAIYIGLGAGSLLGELKNVTSRSANQLSPVLAGICLLLVAVPVFSMKHHYYTHDRSRNYTCPVYARNMLMALEKDAIIFTNGDNDTFPLWYIQDVEEFRTDVRVVNLSLLNTPWYIKQCRDNEPTTPISWTDRQIDALRPQPTSGGWLLIRDLGVREILKTNLSRPPAEQKPVYFAVTIPTETYAPYRQYLEMEGLAYRVVPKQGENMINVTRMERNVTENYQYTSILDADWKRDRSVYLPPHTEHLIQNYAAAFIQLSWIMHQDSVYDKAAKYMAAAYEISPHMQAPRQMLGLFYLDAGDTTRAFSFYEDKLAVDPDDLALKYRLAGLHERLGDFGAALDLLDEVVASSPNDRDLLMTAYFMAMRIAESNRARDMLVGWLAVHPNDGEIRNMLADLDRQIQSPEGATTEP